MSFCEAPELKQETLKLLLVMIQLNLEWGTSRVAENTESWSHVRVTVEVLASRSLFQC